MVARRAAPCKTPGKRAAALPRCMRGSLRACGDPRFSYKNRSGARKSARFCGDPLISYRGRQRRRVQPAGAGGRPDEKRPVWPDRRWSDFSQKTVRDFPDFSQDFVGF